MGEHRIPRDLAGKARDLSHLKGSPATATPEQPEDTWNPVRPEFSCACCFWNWRDQVAGVTPPQVRAICHLMPQQMMLTSQNQLAGSKPGFYDPTQELCSGWKSRDLPPAKEATP